MGLLADFGAGFFADQAQQIAQRRELSVQEAIFEKRRKLQLEDEERRAMRQTTARADELNATRQPFQRGGLLFDRKFDVSPEGRLTTTDQELGPAPVVPDGPTFTRYDGKNRFTSQLMSDGSFRDLGAGSPVRQSEGGSSGGKKLTTVSNPDGSKFLYNEAGELVRELPSKGGSKDARAAIETATERRLSDYRSEIKSIDTEKDPETGMSQFDEWLMTNNLPSGQTKAQALELMRKSIRNQVATEFGAPEQKPASKPTEEKPKPKADSPEVKKAVSDLKKQGFTDQEIRDYLRTKDVEL